MRGELLPKNKCCYYEIGTPEKFFIIMLLYHSPVFEAWKVPKRQVEVSCDVMPHLAANQTAVESRTNSSG